MNEAPLITKDSPHSDHRDWALPGGVVIRFQKGAMELERNGVTTEELLNVLILHIAEFQMGKFACIENAAVLDNLRSALYWVVLRAQLREAQGVKGRDGVHASRPTDGHVEPMLRWFECGHLPDHLIAASRPFAILAKVLCANIDRSAERTVALRKLLESKDAAVRATLPDPAKPQAGQAGPC